MKLPTKDGLEQWMWRCDASDHDWVEFQWWPDDHDFPPYLMVAALLWPKTWRSRLKGAWAALWGKQVPAFEVLLTYEDAQEMIEALGSVEWSPKVDG